jgi:hypothetical protein
MDLRKTKAACALFLHTLPAEVEAIVLKLERFPLA